MTSPTSSSKRSVLSDPHTEGHSRTSRPGATDPNVTHSVTFLAPKTHEQVRHLEVEEIQRVVNKERHIHHVVTHLQPVLVRDDELNAKERVTEREEPLEHIHERHAAGTRAVATGAAQGSVGTTNGASEAMPNRQEYTSVHTVYRPLYDPVIDRTGRAYNEGIDAPPTTARDTEAGGLNTSSKAHYAETGIPAAFSQPPQSTAAQIQAETATVPVAKTQLASPDRFLHRNEEIGRLERDPSYIAPGQYGTATVYGAPPTPMEQGLEQNMANMRLDGADNRAPAGGARATEEENEGGHDRRVLRKKSLRERDRERATRASGEQPRPVSTTDPATEEENDKEGRPRRRLHKSPPRSLVEERERRKSGNYGNAENSDREMGMGVDEPVSTVPGPTGDGGGRVGGPTVQTTALAPPVGMSSSPQSAPASPSRATASPNKSEKPSLFRRLKGEPKV